MARTLFAASLLSVSAGSAFAQIQPGPFVVRLEQAAAGFAAPLQAKSPGDGTGRLFIIDQVGEIRILQDGVLLPTPFLTITDLVPLNAGYDERGLLGLAFHPDFAENGRFFVHYTAARAGQSGEPCNSPPFGCSSEVIAEFQVSATDPNIADLASRRELLRVPKPQFNHAGGGLEFGPDGMLYVALGDGGGANDGLADDPPSHGPTGNAQNLATPLGKILRYDVSTPGMLTVPPDNPFVSTPGAFGGIWAYGLRNPYSMSFDDAPGGDGRLIVGDVGQDAFEEIDIITRGGNYGWPRTEGFHCFDPFDTTNPPPSCDRAGLTDPIAEYGREDGVAIVGGYVYRGSRVPALRGWYIFGDFSVGFASPNGHLYLQNPADPGNLYTLRLPGNAPLNLFMKGFGRDERGEIYALATTSLGPAGITGLVLRITQACTADINSDGFLDFFDYGEYVDFFESGDLAADLNLDDFIDFFDYAAFVEAFETGC